MTPEQLREITHDAIACGEREHRKKLDKAEVAKVVEEKKIKLEAERCISEIPDAAKYAASAGRNKVIVMGLNRADFNSTSSMEGEVDGYIDTKTFNGKVAEIVWDHCIKAGFKPTIECWHDGVGISSGYHMVIHW